MFMVGNARFSFTATENEKDDKILQVVVVVWVVRGSWSREAYQVLSHLELLSWFPVFK